MDLPTWRDPRLGTPRELRLSCGTIRYHRTGTGPVLVFVHGYLVNANLWRELVPLLSNRFTCVTPDWPLGAHLEPMRPDADLSPTGVAGLIGEVLAALDLRDVTLVGNDSGGAYSQIAATGSERVARLVLNSCETPWCTWPPTHGGFGILKTAARFPATHLGLHLPLWSPAAWRLPVTYGWLAKRPIDATVMRGYTRPMFASAAIRSDGRKAIGAVDIRFVKDAAERIRESFNGPILCAWAAEDRVFPLDHARRYAKRLHASLATVDDSYTYTAEDRPGRTAEILRDWLATVG